MLSLPLESIDRAEAYRYMGLHTESPSPDFTKRVDRCEQMLIQRTRPRFLYQVHPLTFTENGIPSIRDLLLSGSDIAAHLSGCTQVILLAATLSAQADLLIQQAELRDMTDALILDTLASAGIEQICNRAERLIKERLPNLYFTWRYSPGYGDLPMDLQPSLIALLDAARKIGLTVTDTNILIPRKSVTAIIGLSDTPLPPKRRGCAVCTMRDRCPYRMKGVHCGYVETASDT